MVSLVMGQCREESCFVMVTVDLTQQREAEDALRSASARLLQSQDEERRRIARELHDDTAQNLAAALLHLNTDEPRACDVRDARQLIGESYRELRTVSYLLHPPWLDESGFEPAVEWYVNGFAARTGIQCDLSLQLNDRRAPNDLELALFRIVQEALTNVHRHSKATRCEIHVQICGEAIDLRVRDNGTGIPPSLMARIRSGALLGVGLVGMNERVRQLGGRMEISSDGNGTTVRVTAPLS
jgi:signal transduction histidine kinase